MLVFNVNDHSNVPFIFRTVRVHFSAHHLLTDDFQRFLSTIFFVFLWFPAKGTYNMADNTSGPSVVNFWTMLKVRDIASARPVARPIIVRFWYYLLIIFLLFLRWRQPQVSKALPAACHRVLEGVSEETPYRHPH